MEEYINYIRLSAMEKEMGCVFCDDGIFAEMSLDLENYSSKTLPITNVDFKLYTGNANEIREIVSLVDENWCKYFNENTPVFCGYIDEQIVSFCILNTNADCIISRSGIKVGSIGCVGTVPKYRGRGIGLRMVDLATLMLKNENCNKAYISYTHIDSWYEKLGYHTFARFSIV